MKIGIMGAMPQEIDNILNLMSEVEEHKIAARTYYSGKINHQDVVLVFSQCGKVAASITANTLITKFDVDFILFTGVAGAVSPELNIGDIVIGDSYYQHDMDASPIFPRFEIPLSGKSIFKAKDETIDKTCSVTSEFLKNISHTINQEALQKFSISSPKCLVGTITSGDQFISDKENHNGLQHEDYPPLAVEMEGAAVAQVCDDHQVDYIIIRTISDKADHSSPIDFNAFLTEVASQYSVGIIKQFL